MTTSVDSILLEAETALEETHIAILAREVKRLRARPDDEALQKLLNDACRKGNQDAHAARGVCAEILSGGAHMAPERLAEIAELAKYCTMDVGSAIRELLDHIAHLEAQVSGASNHPVCRVCGQAAYELPSGVHLKRMNEFGAPGIWQCSEVCEKVRRGGAVVVAELDADSIHPLIDWTESHRVRMQGTADRVNAWFRENSRTVDASQVLQPGMVGVGPWKLPSDHPEWPEMVREGGLLLGSDVSVRVLGWIRSWGWHPVVLHQDDDCHPPRYFWEDPTEFFDRKHLRENLEGWIAIPSDADALRSQAGGEG